MSDRVRRLWAIVLSVAPAVAALTLGFGPLMRRW